jgi:hypothetical protein
VANTFFSGTVYIDSTGAVSSLTGLKVAYVVFVPGTNNDSVTLRDGDGAGDPMKLKMDASTAHDTVQLDFSRKPILFKDGIYCSAISAGAVCFLYTTSEGATQ